MLWISIIQHRANKRFVAPIRRQQQTLFLSLSRFVYFQSSESPCSRDYVPFASPLNLALFPRSHRGAWFLPCPSLQHGCSFALYRYGSALPGAASPQHGSFTWTTFLPLRPSPVRCCHFVASCPVQYDALQSQLRSQTGMFSLESSLVPCSPIALGHSMPNDLATPHQTMAHPVLPIRLRPSTHHR